VVPVLPPTGQLSSRARAAVPYRNQHGTYHPIARVADGGTFAHPDFDGLVINTAPLWEL